MKLVKKSRLAFTQGNSDKVYEVDLCELASRKDERYLVNFRYGKRGNKLREGSKTPNPVELADAEKLFDSVVVSKINKGYYDSTAPKTTAESSSPPPSNTSETVSALIELMLESLKKERDSKRRSRIIWRLGELGDETTGAEIAHFVKRGHWLEDYAIAWSLGRLRAKNQLSDIDTLLNSKNENVRNIAFEVKLLLSDTSSRKHLLTDTLQRIPSELREVLVNANSSHDSNTKVQQQLLAALNQADADANTLLPDCYRLSLLYPNIYQALLVQLQTQAFVPGSFRGIRKIYKSAELRLDGAVFGLLTQRIESTSPFFNCYDYDWASLPNGGYVTPSKELKKPDSRLAYSNKTRDYLRRRSWRTLHRLGTAGDLRYVDMATQVLLAVRDEHAGQIRNTQVYRWQQHGGNWQNVLISSKQYDIFASFLSFNHILFENSDHYALGSSARAWEKTEQSTEETQRTECFAHLWDQKPENALALLKQSHCMPVHAFARKVLEANNAYMNTLTASDIEALLCSPYESTCQFALSIVRSQLINDSGVLKPSLLLALLRSTLSEARELGIECLNRISITVDDINLIAELLLILRTDVSAPIFNHINALSFSTNEQEKLLLNMIDKIFKLTGDISEEHMGALANFTLDKLSLAVQTTPLTLIERLLASEYSAKQLFGAHLLVGHTIDFGDIPRKMLEQINNASSEVVRSMAAALLGPVHTKC